MSIPANFMNQMVSEQLASQTREFLRPRSTFERLQLILSITWLMLAFLGSIHLQAIVFFLVIGLIIFNRLNLLQEEVRPFLNDVFKFSIFFFLFILLKQQPVVPIELFDIIILDIILLQKYILAGFLVLGVFLRNIRSELLKPTKKNMITNYLDFIFQGLKGLGTALFLYIFFELFNWLPSTDVMLDTFIIGQDVILIIASIAILLSSQSPEGSAMKQLMLSELFLTSETRLERIRDSLFKISIIILFFIHIVPIFGGLTLSSGDLWNDAATLIFVIAIITFIVAFAEPKQKRSSSDRFSSLLSQKSAELMPEKFKNFRETIQDATVNPDTTQYYKLNTDLPIVNKAKTKFIAKKNSVAIPIKETSEGVAVVFVGENELINEETNSQNSMPSIQKIEESATAIIIPNNVWQSTYEKLESFKPNDETIAHLALKGIETKEKLVSLAESALSDFKLMTLPQNLTNRMEGMINNFQRGRYFISDTQKGTHIRLPGITVIENEDYTFVRVLGIKVLDAKGSTVVSTPFLKVIDTPEYDFVSLPFLKVIDVGGNSLVNIAGFQIQEGNQAQIDSAMKKISSDSLQLDSAFEQLDNQLNKVLESPEQLMLTRTASGKQIELISGIDSDRAIIGGNLLPPVTSHRKPIHKKKKRKEKRRVKHGLDVTITTEETDGEITHRKQLHSDRNVQLLDKFTKIIRVTQGDVHFDRLKRQLDFDSIEDLEDWLLTLGFEHVQINWEENKLLITAELRSEVEKLNSSE